MNNPRVIQGALLSEDSGSSPVGDWANRDLSNLTTTGERHFASSGALSDEVTRATTAENLIDGRVVDETKRATLAERDLATLIDTKEDTLAFSHTTTIHQECIAFASMFPTDFHSHAINNGEWIELVVQGLTTQNYSLAQGNNNFGIMNAKYIPIPKFDLIQNFIFIEGQIQGTLTFSYQDATLIINVPVAMTIPMNSLITFRLFWRRSDTNYKDKKDKK